MRKRLLTMGTIVCQFLAAVPVYSQKSEIPGNKCALLMEGGVVSEDHGSSLRNSILGVYSRDVRPGKPTEEDYSATLSTASYQILRNLPTVTDVMPKGLRGRRFTARRDSPGAWSLLMVGSLPPSIQARLEALYQGAVKTRGGEDFTFFEAEMRFGMRTEVTETFHQDKPSFLTILDSWGGAKTLFVGVTGHVFQVESNEAVLHEDAIHASPPLVVPIMNHEFCQDGLLSLNGPGQALTLNSKIDGLSPGMRRLSKCPYFIVTKDYSFITSFGVVR